MLNIRIERFGGNVGEDNSINLFAVLTLSTQVGNHSLTKNQELLIPNSEAEIYALIYKLQPLVCAYCEKELWNQQKP